MKKLLIIAAVAFAMPAFASETRNVEAVCATALSNLKITCGQMRTAGICSEDIPYGTGTVKISLKLKHEYFSPQLPASMMVGVQVVGQSQPVFMILTSPETSGHTPKPEAYQPSCVAIMSVLYSFLPN